jgi:hypothetical protein
MSAAVRYWINRCIAAESSPKATSVAEAVRVACAAQRIDHDVAECVVAGTVARLRTVLSFADVEAAIRSVLPDAYVTRQLNVHPAHYCGNRKDYATLAQAQEAAAAVIAEYGGTVDVRHYDEDRKGDALGDVQVTTHGIEIGIFFFSEEVPPCSAS